MFRCPDYWIRCVRRVSAETQLSASEGKVADIGGINILKGGETAAPIHVKRLTLLIRGVGDSRVTEVRETVERYRSYRRHGRNGRYRR